MVEEEITGATTMPVSIRSKRKGRKFALESLTGKSHEPPATGRWGLGVEADGCFRRRDSCADTILDRLGQNPTSI